MIIHKNKEITEIIHKNKVITEVYRGARLIWQAITSCFGAGYWRNDYPWKNFDCWKNKS